MIMAQWRSQDPKVSLRRLERVPRKTKSKLLRFYSFTYVMLVQGESLPDKIVKKK